jgi:UDP-N-acetylmuramoyl-L-alanyl-D-glutamate--2,6-diaminopimelate ligase
VSLKHRDRVRKHLGELLEGMELLHLSGDPGVEVEGLEYDSRRVGVGSLFVALRGQHLDGHDFISEAIERGAVAVVAEAAWGGGESERDVAMVQVRDSREALSRIAVRFYNRPFQDIKLIGITGTNGKTTTSYILESILLASGARPGVIGTINYRLGGESWDAPVTTPESLDLMRILRRMADLGATHVVMEVSSHALDQGRVRDCPFRVGVFTNISRDHLDYHQSMESYFSAKAILFRTLGQKGRGNLARGVINADDPEGRELIRQTQVPVVTYGMGMDCDFRAIRVQGGMGGLSARLITPSGETDIRSPLVGEFNIYNILAASAAASCLGIDLSAIGSGIALLEKVPGRLESIENSRSLSIVVDYAHTPDALLKALRALRPLARGRLITLFGCGGDRDKGKRSQMGLVAGENSDLVFITSDNPRTEDPAAIAMEIEKGVRGAGLEMLTGDPRSGLVGPGYHLDLDRRNAIRKAIGAANEGDLILIAGKGHEDYQIIGTEKMPFDDRRIAAEVVLEKGSAGLVG